MMVDKNTISEAIDGLKIGGQPICLHASLKSFGHVDGGPETIIRAFLDAGCTMMVPVFSDMFEVFPPLRLRPERNGAGDYSYFEKKAYSAPAIFSTACNHITKEEMGIIAYTIVNWPERKRGYHPLNSFAAIGQCADSLVKNQSLENVYAPLAELCNQNAFVLLMGVDLKQATIIHYAEQVAGRKPFIRWAYNAQGETAAVSAGGCSDGFNHFEDMLKPIEQDIMVGKSLWRCFSAGKMADICSAAIRETPEITHCQNPECSRCNDAVLGGPIW